MRLIEKIEKVITGAKDTDIIELDVASIKALIAELRGLKQDLENARDRG